MRFLDLRPASALLVLLTVTAVTYANSLPNTFTFDDHPIVENNAVLERGKLSEILTSPFWPGQPELGLYRPVTTLSFALNRWIGGTDPVVYRVTNILMHGLCGWLIYVLLSGWFGRASGMAGALVFVTHSVHSESVNAIVGRAELMAGGFCLLAWVAHSRDSRAWQVVSVASYALACLSKEHAIVFPAFLVAESIWLRRSGTLVTRVHAEAKGWIRLVPFALVAAVVLVLRSLLLGSLTMSGSPDFVDNPLAHTDALSRMWTAFSVLSRYVILLLVPLNLSVDYTYNTIPVTTFADPYALAGFGLLAGMMTLAYRSASGAEGGVFGFGCVVFLLFWLPISNLLFAIGTPMNERLMYLPSIGFGILVGAGYGRLEESIEVCPAWVPAVCLVILLGFRTGVRNLDWRDDFSLFASASRVTENSAKTWFNLGNALRDRGSASGALDAYSRAVEIYPQYAEVHYNRGVVSAGNGDLNSAMVAYRKAAEYDPQHVNALNNLGILLVRSGDTVEGVRVLSRAADIARDRADIQFNLGVALESVDVDRAIAAYERSVDLLPGYEDAGVNAALLFRNRGEIEKAMGVLEGVTAANPNAYRAAFELGRAREDVGRASGAIDAYRMAWLGGDEMGQLARYRMGMLFAQSGNADSARAAIRSFVSVWQGNQVLRERATQLLDKLQ